MKYKINEWCNRRTRKVQWVIFVLLELVIAGEGLFLGWYLTSSIKDAGWI